MESIILLIIGSVLIWILFLVIPLLWWKGKKEMALHGLISGVVAWFVAELIKATWYIPRPYIHNGETAVAIHIPSDGSFPSGHTAAAIALAVSLWLHDGKLGWIAIILGLSIGMARVIAKVHYPIDIFGGVILGTVVALVIKGLHLRIEALIKDKTRSKTS